MNNSYQQISITVTSEEQKDILVALLAEAGYEGFVEERLLLKAFIPSAQFSNALLEAILLPMALEWNQEEILQRNWNAEWEAGFQPVIVEVYCAIRADFHDQVAGVPYEVVITPKMSFGTGHHATTYMMVEAMRMVSFQGKKVLDFGTGTGVLAILAEKMGAESIVAIDNDEWSIENAQENIQRNNCSHIQLLKAESIPPSGSYDIILANINRNVVLSQLSGMVKHTLSNGSIIVSGLLAADAPDLQAAIELHKLALKSKLEKNSWLCWELLVKENS